MSIASEITRLQNAKASIKTSIENKGVTVGDGTLDTYASKIDAIETGITPTGTINITENGTYDVTDKASANVNVNSGDVSEYFLPIGTGDYNYSGINNSIRQIPLLSFKGTSAYMSFYKCGYLTSLPQLDTSNITDMTSMCEGCGRLISIPLLDTSKVTGIENMTRYCTNLTDLGGFKNLGQAYSTTQSANYYNYKLFLSTNAKLTHDSLMNVINNLYDIATKGVKTQQLVLGSTNLAKLTAEELAIATNKGFSVS